MLLILEIRLPDSYSTARNNLYDEVHWLSQDNTSSGPTQLPLTTTSSSCSQFRRRQGGQGQNETRVVRANPVAAPDNVVGLVGSIYFNEVGEVVDSTSFQTASTDYEDLQDVPEERTQSSEYPMHHDPVSYSPSEANFRSRYSTGTVIRGDDARNAILRAEEYRGLFDAAERSIPRASTLDSVYETDPSYGMPWDLTTAEATSNEGPPVFVRSSAYQLPPPREQGSPRSIHAATLDPIYLMAPAPVAESGQHTRFDSKDAIGRSSPPINTTSVFRAKSSRASSVSAPSIMSQGSPASCLSTTTISTPSIENGLKCPILGCGHKPFTGPSKANSLSRHKRQHGEKFICQLGTCRAVIGRSDNRRTHLEDKHKTISLPPKSSRPRVRSEPGGIDDIVERCFTRIKP